MDQLDLPIPPAAPPSESQLAITIWNAMDGSIDWQALPILCEINGVEDIEGLIDQLMVIREHRKKRHG